MGILDVKEFIPRIMKPGVNMEHLSGMVSKASGGLTVLVSV